LANGQPCDGGASELGAGGQGAFTRVASTDNVPGALRDYMVAHASSDAAEPPTGFFSRKRASVFMTDVGDDGIPFSADYGVIKFSPFISKLAGCAMALALLGIYFLTASPIVSKKATGLPPLESDLAAATTAPTAVGNGQTQSADVQRSELSLVPEVAGIGDGAWAQLVVACGGDAARAGLVINGVVAADPGLRVQSHEAIVRALAVVKRT